MSDQAFFPLCVSAAAGSVILSSTNNLASHANFIRIDENNAVQQTDTLVVLDGWVNGSHPYSDLTSTGARPGVMGQCPLEIKIPGNFSLSSITLTALAGGSADEWYITYGCVRDVNPRAANTTAGSQNL